MSRMSALLRWVLLRVLPSEFRDRYGDEVAEYFRERSREIRDDKGWLGVVAFWVRGFTDVVRVATAERIAESRVRHSARRNPGLRQRTHIVTVGQDIRYAVRTMRRSPGFTLVALFTLALGIGANAAIFSLVNGVLLRSLPYEAPDRLVAVWSSNAGSGTTRGGVSLHDYADWRARTDAFADVAVYNANTTNLTKLDEPQRVGYALATPSLFTTLGVDAAIGRTFVPEENFPGNDDVVVLSHSFWQNTLGGKTNAVGSTLALDGRSMTVIGVMPQDFAFPYPWVKLWKPFGMLPEDEGSRRGRWVNAVARLRDDMSLEATQAAMTSLAEVLEREFPETNSGFGIYAEPLHATVVGGVRRTLLILWGTTAFVLLIACANLANLLIARATTREREIAVRAALGATRFRLVRQLLSESVPLSVFGAAFGIILAYVGVKLLPVLNDGRIPRLEEVTIDGSVLWYSLFVAVGVGMFFSILPAVRASKGELVPALKEGSRGSEGRRRFRMRNALVIAQIALAMVVVTGAGLLTRSHGNLMRVDPGFEMRNVLTVRVAPSWNEIPERARASQIYREIAGELLSNPVVESVSAVNQLPLAGGWWTTHLQIEGRETLPSGNPRVAYTRVVLPNYHRTMGISVVRGRLLDNTDDAASPNAVLINQAMVDRWWSDVDPIGQRISTGGPWRTIVGVVGNTLHSQMGEPPAPVLYVPFAQGAYGHFRDWGMTFVIRTASSPEALVPAVRQAFSVVVPNLPLYSIATLEEVIESNVASDRFNAQLMGIFAAISLVLAAVGVYSVMAQVVSQRTREIGVRVALGAASTNVLGLVLKRGLTLAAVGIFLGVLTSAWVSRFLAELLYQTSAVDPLTYCVVAVVLCAAALSACAGPAIRAIRVDPVKVIGHE